MTPTSKKHVPHLIAVTPTERELALSVVLAIQLWASPMCHRLHVPEQMDSRIDDAWFKWFTGEWRVGRTLAPDARQEVISYFNSKSFRKALTVASGNRAVDSASQHLKSRGWSAKRKENGIRVKPLSLVSKVAFFIRPTHFAPMDSLSKRGLNRVRGTKKSGGEGHDAYAQYSDYLAVFNENIPRYESFLKKSISAVWAKPLAKELGCPTAALTSPAFRRKVFDNLLMQFGRRTAE